MNKKQYWVYILASAPNGTLYIGMTSDLVRRVHEHKNGAVDGFAKDHAVKHLVYFEEFDSPETAISREKQLKKWRRDWKKNIIEEHNPYWDDLYDALCS